MMKHRPDARRMPTRTLAALAVSALLAATAAVAAPAAAESDCTITDFNEGITLGLPAEKDIRFRVDTDCDDDEDVNWWLTFRDDSQTSYGYPLLANFEQDPSSRYSYIEDGRYTWNHNNDNTQAGHREVTIDAFTGDVTDGNFFSETFDFYVRHRSTFASTFNASPEPRRVGQTIKINANLQFADWENNRYKPFGAYVVLQFKPDGDDEWQDVKWVWDNGASAKTTVKAKKTGTWRYQYRGDGKHSATNSRGDRVVVKKRR